jgi:hypothetical protein
MPNLFIIGAQKSGTTSLNEYLGYHAEIFMSPTKEPGFFVPEATYYPKDIGWYLSLFEGSEGRAFVGEASTHYTKRPLYDNVAPRLAAVVPDARLIYVMRDPIRRAISHYWHNIRTFEEHRSLVQAIHENRTYRDFGDYEYQLRPYLSAFDPERLYALTFEELASDPRSAVDSVLRWLGLGNLPDNVALGRENEAPARIIGVRGRGSLEGVRNNRFWSRLSPLVPQSAKDLAKRLAVKEVPKSRSQEDEVIEALRPWAHDCVKRVAALLGREFPEWTTALGTA